MTVENVFGVILIIIFLLLVMRPMLQRWFGPMLQRWAMGKMEDRIRRMAGMPTRKEEARQRKARSRREASGRRTKAAFSTVRLLRTVAEDVEFTEIKEFSADPETGRPAGRHTVRYKVEEQIEDAEYVEIKN